MNTETSKTQSNSKFVGGYTDLPNLSELSYEHSFYREKEIQRIIEILGKKSKGNVMIVGEPGVGKTNVVKGSVSKIEKHLGKKIVSLNAHFLFHLIQAKFQFDDSVIKVLNRFAQNQNEILFIDNFDLFFKEYKGNELEFDNLLSTFLEQDAIKCIVTVSSAEFANFNKSYIGKFFEPVFVNELTKDQIVDVLSQEAQVLNQNYKVEISKNVIQKSILLADRFLTDTRNPSSAKYLLESTCSHVKYINKDGSGNEDIEKRISDLRYLVESLNREKMLAIQEKEFIRAEEIKKKQRTAEEDYLAAFTEIEDVADTQVMTEDHLRNVISDITKIPINKLNTDNIGKLKNLETDLSDRVVNQEDAIKKLTKAIRRNSVGLRDTNKPVGVFMFIGPTGTGKTYLTKVLAESFYTSEKDIIRLDMSEYGDKIAVNKLFGSAPGYIGYDEGGILTRSAMEKPHSILLFDEIEKAHPAIFNALLQVFDEGHMTDNKGRKVSFKNNIIIMTSNVGCHAAAKKTAVKRVGFGVDVEEDKKHEFLVAVEKEIKEKFPPEFINRIDAKILFNSLTYENIEKIIGLEINQIEKRLVENDITLSYSKKLPKQILDANKDKINLNYGAREVKRLLVDFEDAITDYIIDNGKVEKLKITYNNQYQITHG